MLETGSYSLHYIMQSAFIRYFFDIVYHYLIPKWNMQNSTIWKKMKEGRLSRRIRVYRFFGRIKIF